jgi:hypothetical protein
MKTLHGRTAQGRSVTVYVDGGVKAVRTSTIVTCPTNTYVDWVYRHASQSGDAMSVTDTWEKHYDDGRRGHGTSTIRARVDGDTVNGTVRMIQRIASADGVYTCDSGPVAFSAQR